MRPRVLVLGVVHSAQSDGHLKHQTILLRSKGFRQQDVANYRLITKAIRRRMLQEIRNFKPDIVAEESGPWLTTPADRWKKLTNIRKTVLESSYRSRHVFLDEQIKVGKRKPSLGSRENVMTKLLIRKLRREPSGRRAVFVVGSFHAARIAALLSQAGFSSNRLDLRKQYLGNGRRGTLAKQKKERT